MTERWVVYAAFDPIGGASRHAVDQLKSYRQAGFETLVVDASPVLSPERQDSWRAHATAWTARRNEGYDFGSYRHGLEHLARAFHVAIDQAEIVLTNDSCLGPVFPLAEAIDALRARDGSRRSVFAITDSEEGTRHLQSYWMYFPSGRAALARDFLAMLPPIDNRVDAIRHGERAISQYIVDRGYALEALITVRDAISLFARAPVFGTRVTDFSVRLLLRRPRYNQRADSACLAYLLGRQGFATHLNPTLGLGIDLARARLSPFVKRELIRTNPYDDRRVPTGLRHDDNVSLSRLLAPAGDGA